MESMTCPTCGAMTLIAVRSVDDKFWCDGCKQWKPCRPPSWATEQKRLKEQV